MKRPFRFKAELLLAGLILFVGALSIGIASRALYRDKTDFLRELSVKVTANGSRAWSDRMKAYEKDLVRLASRTEAVSAAKPALRASLSEELVHTPFLAVVQMVRTSSGAWDISTLDRRKDLGEYPADLPSQLQTTLSKELQPTSENRDDVQVKILPRTSAPALVLITVLKAQNAAIVGVTNERAISDLVRAYKGSFTSLYFIDGTGRVLAHPNESLVGVSISKNPVAQQALKSTQKFFSGEVKEHIDVPVYASFEKVADSNVIAVATAPLTEAHRSAKQFILFLTAVFIFVGFAAVAIVRTYSQREIQIQVAQHELSSTGQASESVTEHRTESVSDSVLTVNAHALVPPAPEPRLEPAPGLTPKVDETAIRLEAIENAGKTLSQEFKNPISAILGHIQLAKGKTESPEVHKHLEFISRESRHLKDVLEKISKLGFYKTLSLTRTSTLEVVSEIVDQAELSSAVWGVKMRKNLYPVPNIKISSKDFKKALVDIIVHRAHAMENATVKDLVVHVEPVEDRVRIRIEDHGAALTAESCSNFFEPFSKTSSESISDLKIFSAAAVIKSHGGSVSIAAQSERDALLGVNDPGNIVTIDLPGDFSVELRDENKGELTESRYALLRERVGFDVSLDQSQFQMLESELEQVGADSPASSHFTPPSLPRVLTSELEPNKTFENKQQQPIFLEANEYQAEAGASGLSEFSVKIRKPRLRV